MQSPRKLILHIHLNVIIIFFFCETSYVGVLWGRIRGQIKKCNTSTKTNVDINGERHCNSCHHICRSFVCVNSTFQSLFAIGMTNSCSVD